MHKLSIGMIVKNEEGNLRKCLEGIRQILTQVDCELIIADTGSEDGTVSIAREFTENVFTIPWSGDFAEARNQTLAKADGEWYMYIDADEHFEDVAEIVEFFNTGEYKTYKSASFFIKNHISRDSYNLGVVVRLFKKEADTKFLYAIHEVIPYNLPQKKLNAIANHWGYMFDGDDEKRKAKHERNITPMLKIYGENPSDIRNVSQIAREYSLHQNPEELLKFLEIGIRLVRDNPNDPYFHFFFEQYAKYYLENGSADDKARMLALINEYFQKTSVVYTTAIDMYALQGDYYALLGKPAESEDAYRKAASALEIYRNGGLNTDDLIANVVYAIKDGWLFKTAVDRIKINLESGRCENAFYWADLLDLAENNVLPIYLLLAERSKRYDLLIPVYNKIAAYRNTDKAAYDKLIDQFELLTLSSSNYFNVISIFADTSVIADSDYTRLQHLRYQYEIGDEAAADALKYFLEPGFLDMSPEPSTMYSDVIVIAMENGVDFTPFIERADIDAISEYLKKIFTIYKDFKEIFLDYMDNAGDNVFYKSFTANYWLTSICGVILSGGGTSGGSPASAAATAQRLKLFDLYTTALYKHMLKIYSPSVLNDNDIGLLPGAYRFGYFVKKALDRLESGDLTEYVRHLKTALTHSNALKDVVMLHIKRATERANERRAKAEAEAESNKVELKMYTEAIKHKIFEMISNGQYDMANKVLTTYEGINPDDREIDRLRDLMH